MDLSQIGNITESPYNNSGTNYSVENTTFYNDYAYYNYDYFAYPVFLRESLAGMFRKRMYLNLSMVLPQLLTVLINAYVIGCFAALEELRRGEYFLVFYQSFFDFLCSIIGLAYNSIVLLYFQDQYCIHRRFLSWMYGVDFKDIFMKCDMLSDYQWMNFRRVYYGDLRWPLEILSGVNYFSNCYCLIALAYERYVYTVKFADAKTILTTRRRVVTYSAIAFLTVLVPALLYLDVRLAEKRDGFFGIWGDCDSCFHRGGNENGTRIDFFKMLTKTNKPENNL
ncbi:uncharacterized protein LOC134854506 isoform X2 [Symsagittifera roscoffensis]|uniref:uncharacterized protein LOC134854506 isoform X2 n=1 Tax=Symsagittifera roscoffensis TaxID=84072 RepID=UPI00307BEEA0